MTARLPFLVFYEFTTFPVEICNILCYDKEQKNGNPEGNAMKQLKPRRLIAAVCAFAMMTVSALADTALVVTPKGPLNLRKSPTVNSDRLASIPNHTTIEILKKQASSRPIFCASPPIWRAKRCMATITPS